MAAALRLLRFASVSVDMAAPPRRRGARGTLNMSSTLNMSISSSRSSMRSTTMPRSGRQKNAHAALALALACAQTAALSLATPHAKPCRTSALRAAVVSDELGHLDKNAAAARALRFDGMIAFDRRRRRLPRVPVVSKYAEYVGELWRADEASTARSDVVEVGRGTTLATRVTTGVGLGLLFTYWTMVPNWAFALGMLLQALVAQLEYFRMAIIRGARPARRIVMAASIAAMAVAAGAPALHELVFPVGATWMMLRLCLMRKHASSIQDISTSLMGLFYTAYLPVSYTHLTLPTIYSV